MGFFEKEIYFKEIGSTNDFLKRSLLDKRAIVFSFNQLRGRGREQKKWIDFKDKNLALSFSIKAEDIIFDPIWYIAATSLALVELLKELKISDVWLKWPNDIYVLDKKISGVLAESIWRENKIIRVVVGIGINLNNSKEDLNVIDKKATSIMLETGQRVNLRRFYKKYKKRLIIKLKEIIEQKSIDSIKAQWLEYSLIKSKLVIWEKDGKVIKGLVKDIKNDGTVIMISDDIEYMIKSGDISLA